MALSREEKKSRGFSKFSANVVLNLEMDSPDRKKVDFVWRHVQDSLRRSFDSVEITVEPNWQESDL